MLFVAVAVVAEAQYKALSKKSLSVYTLHRATVQI